MVHVNISHVNELIDKTMQGWGHSRGVTKPFSTAALFSEFFRDVKAVKYHVLISQWSSHLICGEAWQIWMWFKCSNLYFRKGSQEKLTEFITTLRTFYQFKTHDFGLTIEYGIPSVICGYVPSIVCSVSPIYWRNSNTAVLGRSDINIEYSEKSKQQCGSSNYSTDILKFVLIRS